MKFQHIIGRWLIAPLLAVATYGASSSAIAQVPSGQLIFKGTHNSYQCHYDTPCMNHPPDVQIDDFGVWEIELDVGFVRGADGNLTAVLGHTRPEDAVCWGSFPNYPRNSLTGFLNMIYKAQSRPYRPIVIYFDWKYPDWGELCPDNDCYGFGKSACEAVFGKGNVLGWEEARNKSVPELAGKVILTTAQLAGQYYGDCTNKETVGGWFKSDPGLNFFRIDQYQGDWTFDIGAPPNPLVVDAMASPTQTIMDSVGDNWFCITGIPGDSPNCTVLGVPATCDIWKGQIVHQQGTYRFPYKSLGRAVTRAQGITPTGDPSLLPRRTGYGWTVLIKPGNYSGALTITTPLTLKKFDGSSGIVVIGQQ